MEKIVYCVAGIGYKDDCVTDHERDWGTYDTEEQARAIYDEVIENACEEPSMLFNDTDDVDTWLIQLEYCIEDDWCISCEDVLEEETFTKEQ